MALLVQRGLGNAGGRGARKLFLFSLNSQASPSNYWHRVTEWSLDVAWLRIFGSNHCQPWSKKCLVGIEFRASVAFTKDVTLDTIANRRKHETEHEGSDRRQSP